MNVVLNRAAVTELCSDSRGQSKQSEHNCMHSSALGSDCILPVSGSLWIPNPAVESPRSKIRPTGDALSGESTRCRTSSIDRSSFSPPSYQLAVTSLPLSRHHQVVIDKYATLRRPCRSAVQRSTEATGSVDPFDRCDRPLQRRPAHHRSTTFDDADEERLSPFSSSTVAAANQVSCMTHCVTCVWVIRSRSS